MNKSKWIKVSAAALTFLGISATGMKPVSQTVNASSKRIKVVAKKYVTVWTNYQNGRHVATHAKKGTAWMVLQTAKDSMGNVWYRVGKNQWVMAKYVKQAVKAKKTKPVKAKSKNKKVKQTVKKAKTKAVSAVKLAASWGAPMGSRAKANAVVSLAKQQVGKAYSKGSTGPKSFDNTGLVAYVYKKAAGVNTGRSVKDQSKQGIAVDSTKNLQKGDLLFWGSATNPYSVGIYVGGGKYVAATGSKDGVVQTTLSSYFWPSKARRVL